MTPEQFVMWLRGYIDGCLSGDPGKLDAAVIKTELDGVLLGSGNAAYAQSTGLGPLANAGVNRVGGWIGGAGEQRVGNFDVKKG